MRITIAQGPFLPVPPLMGGAIEKFFYPLARLWAAQGHSVTHISRAYNNLPTRQVAGGVTYLRVPSHSATRNGFLNKFFDFDYSLRVLKVLPEADILVTHTFFLPILATHPERHGKVYVHAARFPRGQLSLYGKAAALQFPSSAVLAAAREQAPQFANKMRVIPNGLPFALPELASRAAPASLLRLLYTGRIHPEKGLDLLLAALALLPPQTQMRLSLTVVGFHEAQRGGAGEAYLDSLKKAAATLATKVTFIPGTADSALLATYYQQADWFVYPSLAQKGETFGVAPLEALAYGVPVIVSALGCFCDFVRDGDNGLIFDHRGPAAAKALAETIAAALMCGEKYASLSHAARATAEGYTLGAVSELFIKDFVKLLETR